MWHFPDVIFLLQLKQAEIPVFWKKKVLSGILLSFPPPPKNETLIVSPPEIFVIQSNQVQMVFASSDITGSKVFVVIY